MKLSSQIIKELTQDELEARRSELLNELKYNSYRIPFSLLMAIRESDNPEVKPISNSMLCVLIAFLNGKTCTYDSTVDWFDDPEIEGFLKFSYDDDEFIYLLDQVQLECFGKIRALRRMDPNYPEQVEAIIKEYLIADELKESEKEDPIVKQFIIPENSETTEIAENTSRFSGATWFEEIQKKVIVLAGLGGIGSYTCFLLSRMQPTSIFIYDDDKVEAVNMSGQLYGSDDIDKYKVDAIAAMVSNYSSYGSVFAYRERFTRESEAADIMICGFDNMEARKTFFNKWSEHIQNKSPEEKKHCLFIDGRLSAECLQVFCLVGDDTASIDKYAREQLFSDEDADETVCSYKQTTYMANMIGSLIVNAFTNFVANEVAGAPIRELPYFTSYDGNSMQLKIE